MKIPAMPRLIVPSAAGQLTTLTNITFLDINDMLSNQLNQQTHLILPAILALLEIQWISMKRLSNITPNHRLADKRRGKRALLALTGPVHEWNQPGNAATPSQPGEISIQSAEHCHGSWRRIASLSPCTDIDYGIGCEMSFCRSRRALSSGSSDSRQHR